MTRYALLLAPSANRVYTDAAPRLARAELEIFGGSVLSGRPAGISEQRLAGVRYLGFDAELTEADLGYLANLSSIYALFERVGDDLLRPVALRPLERDRKSTRLNSSHVEISYAVFCLKKKKKKKKIFCFTNKI